MHLQNYMGKWGSLYISDYWIQSLPEERSLIKSRVNENCQLQRVLSRTKVLKKATDCTGKSWTPDDSHGLLELHEMRPSTFSALLELVTGHHEQTTDSLLVHRCKCRWHDQFWHQCHFISGFTTPMVVSCTTFGFEIYTAAAGHILHSLQKPACIYF